MAFAPVSEAPVRVTVLPAPTFFVSKVAVPPVSVTTSAPTTPVRLRAVTVAPVVPS